MIASINAGIRLSFIYELHRPLVQKSPTIGTVVALVRAKIDKFFLEGWLNIQNLQALRPDRVTIVNNMVTLKGPVLILPSMQHIHVLKYGMPILMGVLVALAVRALYICITTKDPKTPRGATENGSDTIKERAIMVICGGATALLSFGLARSILPSTPGIYFY